MTDLADLLAPDTAGAVKARLLSGMRTVGFPVDSWSAFSVPRALLEVFSTALADVTLRIANVAKLGFLRYAVGDWLTVLAREVYDVEREPAIATVGAMQLAAAPSAGPYDFAPGDLVAAAPAANVAVAEDAIAMLVSGLAWVEARDSARNTLRLRACRSDDNARRCVPSPTPPAQVSRSQPTTQAPDDHGTIAAESDSCTREQPVELPRLSSRRRSFRSAWSSRSSCRGSAAAARGPRISGTRGAACGWRS